MDVIKKKKIVEVQPGDLVGEFVGKTAPKTMKVIESTKNSVLFIDEAYRLTSSSEKDYGHEALESIMKFLEGEKKADDSPVFIFVGYANEIENFMDQNSGFRRRCSHFINILDASDEELAAITRIKLYGQKFVFPANFNFEAMFGEMGSDIKTRYNASLAEKYLTFVQPFQIKRNINPTDQELFELTQEDMDFAMTEMSENWR